MNGRSQVPVFRKVRNLAPPAQKIAWPFREGSALIRAVRACTEQRKLAAIIPLCGTDRVGCCALSQRNEPLALELLERHRGVLRGLLLNHRGTEIKTTGDGFPVAFRFTVEGLLFPFWRVMV